MSRQRSFWLGLAIGFIIGFLYGWLSISATYMELEREHRKREAELEDIKKIIYYSTDILRQREEAIEWNLRTTLPVPEWAEAEENQ